MTIPAGWIPPEDREFVYADGLRESDLEAIRQTMKIVDESGNVRVPTDEDIAEAGIQRVRGVLDRRTGKYHPNLYFED